jgi:muramoyltetrapeptide carboxypeptidase
MYHIYSKEELIWEKVKEYNYPVCFDFLAGHIKNNLALKLGIPYEFSVSVTDVILNEKPGN